MRGLRTRYQILDNADEVEREPGCDASRPVGIPRPHEVRPVGFHLAGKLLFVCAERRLEVEQELKLGAVFRRGWEAVHIVGWFDRGAEPREGGCIGIVEFVAEHWNEAREINVGIRSVAGEYQVGKNLRQGFVRTGC